MVNPVNPELFLNRANGLAVDAADLEKEVASADLDKTDIGQISKLRSLFQSKVEEVRIRLTDLGKRNAQFSISLQMDFDHVKKKIERSLASILTRLEALESKKNSLRENAKPTLDKTAGRLVSIQDKYLRSGERVGKEKQKSFKQAISAVPERQRHRLYYHIAKEARNKTYEEPTRELGKSALFNEQGRSTTNRIRLKALEAVLQEICEDFGGTPPSLGKYLRAKAIQRTPTFQERLSSLIKDHLYQGEQIHGDTRKALNKAVQALPDQWRKRLFQLIKKESGGAGSPLFGEHAFFNEKGCSVTNTLRRKAVRALIQEIESKSKKPLPISSKSQEKAVILKETPKTATLRDQADFNVLQKMRNALSSKVLLDKGMSKDLQKVINGLRKKHRDRLFTLVWEKAGGKALCKKPDRIVRYGFFGEKGYSVTNTLRSRALHALMDEILPQKDTAQHIKAELRMIVEMLREREAEQAFPESTLPRRIALQEAIEDLPLEIQEQLYDLVIENYSDDGRGLVLLFNGKEIHVSEQCLRSATNSLLDMLTQFALFDELNQDLVFQEICPFLDEFDQITLVRVNRYFHDMPFATSIIRQNHLATMLEEHLHKPFEEMSELWRRRGLVFSYRTASEIQNEYGWPIPRMEKINRTPWEEGLMDSDELENLKEQEYENGHVLYKDLPAIYRYGKEISLIKFYHSIVQEIPYERDQANEKAFVEQIKDLTVSDQAEQIDARMKLSEAVHNLYTLTLSQNVLIIPRQVDRLRSLEQFDGRLSHCRVLPSSMGNLHRLTSLILGGNYLAAVPKEIRSCGLLKGLYLECNNIHFLPKEVGALAQVRRFNLRHNFLMELPEEMVGMVSLRELDLSENNLLSVPGILSRMKLQKLDILWNPISRAYRAEPWGTFNAVFELRCKMPEALRRLGPNIQVLY